MSAWRKLASLLAAAMLVPGLAARSWASPPEPTCTPRGIGQDSGCTVNGVRLHLVDYGGKGPPLILLAGLNNTARIFDDFAPILAERRHVYAFTRRGFGLSDQPPAYDMPLLVGDILGLMAVLGIERADIVGHSIAGAEMTALAAAHPERVRRLVYIDAAYDRSAISTFPPDPIGSRSPPFSARVSPSVLAAWRMRQLGVRSAAIAADLNDTYVRDADGSLVPRTPLRIVRAISTADRATPPAYAHVEAPALALYAPKDSGEQIPPEATAAQARASRLFALRIVRPWMLRERARFLAETPCSQARIVPHAGHYMFLEKPRDVARYVLRFLESSHPCLRRDRSRNLLPASPPAG